MPQAQIIGKMKDGSIRLVGSYKREASNWRRKRKKKRPIMVAAYIYT